MSPVQHTRESKLPRRLRSRNGRKDKATQKPSVLAQFPNVDGGTAQPDSTADNAVANLQDSYRVDQAHAGAEPKLSIAESTIESREEASSGVVTPPTSPAPQPSTTTFAPSTTPPASPISPGTRSYRTDSASPLNTTTSEYDKSSLTTSSRRSLPRPTPVASEPTTYPTPPASEPATKDVASTSSKSDIRIDPGITPPKTREEYAARAKLAKQRAKERMDRRLKPASKTATKKLATATRAVPSPDSAGWTEVLIKIGGTIIAGALILFAAKNMRVKMPPVPTASEPVWQIQGPNGQPLQPRVAATNDPNQPTRDGQPLNGGAANNSIMPPAIQPALSPAPANGTNNGSGAGGFTPIFMNPDSGDSPQLDEPLRLNSSQPHPANAATAAPAITLPTSPSVPGAYPSTEFPGLYPEENPNASARLNGIIQEFPR